MKKILTLTLTSIIGASLIACGSDKDIKTIKETELTIEQTTENEEVLNEEKEEGSTKEATSVSEKTMGEEVEASEETKETEKVFEEDNNSNKETNPSTKESKASTKTKNQTTQNKSDATKKSAETKKSTTNTKTAETSKSKDTNKSSKPNTQEETKKQTETSKPKETKKPVETTKPKETEKPVETTKPKETAPPETSSQAEVVKPLIPEGWIFEKSDVGSALNSTHKAQIDSWVQTWKTGGMSDDELKTKIQYYLAENAISYFEVDIMGNIFFISEESPSVDYFHVDSMPYAYVGVYSTGQKDVNSVGNHTIFYKWMVYIR